MPNILATYGAAGAMKKADYDPDEDGVVNDADELEGNSLAQVRNHDPKAHTHVESDITELVADLAGKSDVGHTHVEAEITDLDHDAQKVKGVIIDDSNKADQKLLGYDLASNRIVYIMPAPAGAVIKSVQRGYMDLYSGAGSLTHTISAVDTSKAAVYSLGVTHYSSNMVDGNVWLELLDESTVRAQRENTDNHAIIAFEVIEWESGIKSIQPIDIIIADGVCTGEVTITAVDMSKTMLLMGGKRYGSNSVTENECRTELRSSTTVRAARAVSSGVLLSRVTVMEFE